MITWKLFILSLNRGGKSRRFPRLYWSLINITWRHCLNKGCQRVCGYSSNHSMSKYRIQIPIFQYYEKVKSYIFECYFNCYYYSGAFNFHGSHYHWSTYTLLSFQTLSSFDKNQRTCMKTPIHWRDNARIAAQSRLYQTWKIVAEKYVHLHIHVIQLLKMYLRTSSNNPIFFSKVTLEMYLQWRYIINNAT